MNIKTQGTNKKYLNFLAKMIKRNTACFIFFSFYKRRRILKNETASAYLKSVNIL